MRKSYSNNVYFLMECVTIRQLKPNNEYNIWE